MPDEVDGSRLNKMHGPHAVAEAEERLSCLEGKLPASKVVKMAFDFVEHDSDHVRRRRTLARYLFSRELLMLRIVLFLALLLPVQAYSQAGQHQMGGMPAMPGSPQVSSMPTQPGQGAFAAIQEIVGILEADPKTDWSKVNIEALRQHLIDMDNVTLRAEVKSDPVDGGMRFIVSGVGPVKESIQRMVMAHAATMNGVGSWKFTAAEMPEGATLTVLAPAKDTSKLRALGFIGVMTRGMHHQVHHLMIARGDNPHG